MAKPLLPTKKQQKRTWPMDDFIRRLQNRDRNQQAEIKSLKEQLRSATAQLSNVAKERDDQKEMVCLQTERGFEREARILDLKFERAFSTLDRKETVDVERARAKLEETRSRWMKKRKGKEAARGSADDERLGVEEVAEVLLSIGEERLFGEADGCN